MYEEFKYKYQLTKTSLFSRIIKLSNIKDLKAHMVKNLKKTWYKQKTNHTIK